MKKIIIALSFLSYLFSIDVTSGGGLSKNQQGIDIIHYDIRPVSYTHLTLPTTPYV